MSPQTRGIHHVTAIAGDPDRNAEFYVGTLGLRMVKRTVNHDDTGTYHFYFGDAEGTPGTNITFFPWTEEGRQGEYGAGQTKTTAYLIPEDSVDYWTDRLDSEGVEYEREERFNETALRFEDPDGIELELVAADAEGVGVPWADSPVPEQHQLRGFYGVTLAVAEFGPTAEILTDVLGFELEREAAGSEMRPEGASRKANGVAVSRSDATEASNSERGAERPVSREADGRRRYRAAAGGPRSIVDLVETDAERGRMGVGTVHHVAFEAADVEEQAEWREAYAGAGLQPSQVIDRKYFQSIYTREPGGILFEMATPEPGFDVDEDVEELGSRLTLPERLEAERERIESQLPEFDGPPVGGD